MKHQEWRRHLESLAKEFGAKLEDRGSKLVIVLLNGAKVWCSKTPSHPAPDQVRRDIKRALVRTVGVGA